MLNPGRYKKTDYTGLLGSFIASWLLHCILFAIAATTTIFYPQTADRELISIDLSFASPTSPPADALPQSIEPAAGEVSEADNPAQATDEQSEDAVDRSDLELLTLRTLKPDKEKTPPLKASSPPLTLPMKVSESKPPLKPVIKPVSVKTPLVKPEEAVKSSTMMPAPPVMAIQSKSPDPSQQQKQAMENEKLRRLQEEAAQEKTLEDNRSAERARVAELEKLAAEIARAVELEKLAAERAAKFKLAAEKESIRRLQEAEQKAAHEQAQEKSRVAKLAMAAELEKQEAENAARIKLAVVKAKLEREAAEKARREQFVRLKREQEKASSEKLARERALAEKTAKEKLEQARLAAVALKNQAALPAKPAENPATVVAVAPTAPEKDLLKNQTELKGLAVPAVNGDIKLIMTSEEDLTVKVLFVSHPKARHDKPLSKIEARQQLKLTPIVVRTAKNTLEAVIERSREGIYIFLIEPKGSKPVQGKYSLKLFETKNKSITGREISGQTEIARLLMPEGILWENDSAFSGTIEDSDSVTKFNSESGLVWKEYRR